MTICAAAAEAANVNICKRSLSCSLSIHQQCTIQRDKYFINCGILVGNLFNILASCFYFKEHWLQFGSTIDFSVFENKDKIILVMECADGGELYDYINNNQLTEKDARRVFRQIVSAIKYCHQVLSYKYLTESVHG